MKLTVPSAGPAVDQRTGGYVINIAKRFKAQLVVMRGLAVKEKEADGERSQSLFGELGLGKFV